MRGIAFLVGKQREMCICGEGAPKGCAPPPPLNDDIWISTAAAAAARQCDEPADYQIRFWWRPPLWILSNEPKWLCTIFARPLYCHELLLLLLRSIMRLLQSLSPDAPVGTPATCDLIMWALNEHDRAHRAFFNFALPSLYEQNKFWSWVVLKPFDLTHFCCDPNLYIGNQKRITVI